MEYLPFTTQSEHKLETYPSRFFTPVLIFFLCLALYFLPASSIKAQSSATEITAFSFTEQTGEAILTSNIFKIGLTEINTSSFLELVGASYENKVRLNPSFNPLDVNNLEIRFGSGSQKAHRFTIPAGSGAGVADADYAYQDYIDVPFQVWDVDNNKQLMVSFRDQKDDGNFNLVEFYTAAGDEANHSREYIFIHNIDYSLTADPNIVVNGGHMVDNIYFLWPYLTAGGIFDSNNLPVSTLAIEVANSTVDAEVIYGTDLTALIPTISIAANATVSPSSGLANDFSEPRIYKVTAEDGISFEKYLVTVTKAEDPAIEADSLVLIDLYNSTDGANWVDPWNLEESKTTWIGVAFENGRVTRLDLANRNLSGTIPTTIGSLSELTWLDLGANNINGQIPKEIENLSNNLRSLLLNNNNLTGNLPTVIGDLTGLVNLWVGNNQLEGELPESLGNLTNLLSLSAGDNNFSGTIPASLGNTNILNLYLQNNNLSGAIPPELGDILNLQGLNLEANNLSGRIPDELSNNAGLTSLFFNNNVNLTGSIPLSFVTLNLEEFAFQNTNLCELTDASYQTWKSSVTTYQATGITCDITATDFESFSVAEQAGIANINTTNHTINVEVSFGTSLSALTPTFILSSGAMAEVESIEQISGKTSNDFTIPVTYTITAEDGMTSQDWVVTVSVAPNTETDIIAFSLTEQADDAMIDVLNHTVDIAVIYGTNLTTLSPTIVLSEVATVSPLSDVPQDFTNPVVYTVTAEDGTTMQDWVVTVSVAPNTETDIISFSFTEQADDAMIDVLNHTVDIAVVYGTNLTTLSPTIVLSEVATVSPLSDVPQDFTNPVVYTVTAEDGTTMQDWVVTVIVAPNTETDIISFSFTEQADDAMIDVLNHTVDIAVRYGTNITTLSPTIVLSEVATVSPLSDVPQDFTNPVTYTVTAEDGTTMQDWAVTVIVAPNTEAEILDFVLVEQTSSASIDAENLTVAIEVANGTSLISLTPTISLSDGATVSPNNLEAQDFTNPVTYSVTAEDGTTIQEWVVTVSEEFILGIDDPLFSDRLYPNPANRQVSIDLTAFPKESMIISITDIHGKEVDRKIIDGESIALINISDYKAGIYIVHIILHDKSIDMRFVKE